MNSLHTKFTPKRTLLGLMFGTIIFATAAYDYSNRTRIQDILLSSIYSSNVLVQSNNYQLLAINLQSLKDFNPFVESLAIYVSGKRRTGSGESPKEIVLTEHLAPDSVKISLSGFFTYKAYYVFKATENLLYGSFLEPNRFAVLILMYLMIMLVFAIIYWINAFLDLDRIQAQALKYALSLSGRTLHGLKTHIIHANELYQILTEGRFSLTGEQKVIISDYDLSRIEMDGHMSIIRLENFKESRETLDIEEQLSRLVQIYRRPGIDLEIRCNHQTALRLDRDIFIATAGNVIKNAFDYANRRVWITTEAFADSIRITVANTGKKISKEQLYQLSKGSFNEVHGSGLGLHICRAWLAKLGGTLEMDSNAGATVVEMVFPLAKPSTPLSIQATSNPQAHHNTHAPEPKESNLCSNARAKLSVAIIDDVASFRITLANKLKTFGAHCETFDSLSNFLDQVEKDPSIFSAVIVDRHLRGENAVRDRFPDSCKYLGFKGLVILYSCDPSDPENKNAKHGFDLLLPKDGDIDWEWVMQKIKKNKHI